MTYTIQRAAADHVLAPSEVRAFQSAPRRRFRPWTPRPVAVEDNPVDVTQGRHPVNGADCWGHLLFDVPDLPGTPARAAVYLHTPHWYYNTGGTAVLSLTDAAARRLTRPLIMGGWPRYSSKLVALPGDWLPHLRGGTTGIGIGLPEGIGSDLACYGRFDVPSARLLIWEAGR